MRGGHRIHASPLWHPRLPTSGRQADTRNRPGPVRNQRCRVTMIRAGRSREPPSSFPSFRRSDVKPFPEVIFRKADATAIVGVGSRPTEAGPSARLQHVTRGDRWIDHGAGARTAGASTMRPRVPQNSP